MVKLFTWIKSLWFKKKLHKQFRIAFISLLWLEKHGYSIESYPISFNDYIKAHFNEKNL